MKRFDDFLKKYAEENGLGKDFLSGGWRWAAEGKRKGQSFSMVGGISPCKAGRPKFEGKFNGRIDIGRLRNLLTIVGGAKGTDFLKSKDFLVFPDGRFFIETAEREKADELAMILKSLVLRANFCTGCGLCAGHCPNGAIAIEGGRAVVKDGCRGCLKCLDKCPLEME